MDRAFRRRGGWELLDVVALSDQEQARIERRVIQDLVSGALRIYWSDPASGTFSETPATAEEH
jgi:hypothetical protein